MTSETSERKWQLEEEEDQEIVEVGPVDMWSKLHTHCKWEAMRNKV